MAEELKAFYFPHDIGASNDPKLIDLRIKFGWKAIGMFWSIIETLHKEKNGEISPNILTSLILDFYSQEEIRESKHIIEERQGFEKCLYANALLVALPNGNITSIRVKENLLNRKEKSDKARESANIRWNKPKNDNTNALQTQSERNASKVKERKENKIEEEEPKIFGKKSGMESVKDILETEYNLKV